MGQLKSQSERAKLLSKMKIVSLYLGINESVELEKFIPYLVIYSDEIKKVKDCGMI